MDTRLALTGTPVNILASIGAGQDLAARQAQMGRTAQEWGLYRQHGEGIASGDQNAINALARFDPTAALGVRRTHQSMRHADERMGLARAAAARAAQSHAASLSAAERAEEGQRLGRAVATLIGPLRAGDLETVNQGLRTLGITDGPIGSLDDAAILMAGVETALPYFEAGQAMLGGGGEAERDIRNVGGIAYDFSAYNQTGNPDDLVALTEARDDFVEFTMPDGTTFRQGTGGAPQAAPAEVSTPTVPEGYSLDGAGNAFGLAGFGANIANTAADAVGAPMPFPEVNDARANIDMAAEDLLNATASAYARQPPSWLLQELRNLIPRAGNPFVGTGRAVAQYQTIARRLETEMDAARSLAQATRDRDARADAFSLIQGHTVMLQRVDEILRGIQGGGATTDDDAALIQRYLD